MHTPTPTTANADDPRGYAGTLDGGLSGLPRWRDFETNRKLLAPRDRVRRFQQTARAHPSVSGSIDIMLTLVAAHSVHVKTADGQSEVAADAMRALHGIGDATDDLPLCGMAWHSLVSQACRAPLLEGASPFAVGYYTDSDTGLHIPTLAPRRMANVYRYFADASGELRGIEMHSDVTHAVNGVLIPRFDDDGRVRLVWPAWRGGTNLGIGEGFDGLPIIRSAWADADDALYYRQMMRVAAHRRAVGAYEATVNWPAVFAEYAAAGRAIDENSQRAIKAEYTAHIADHLGYQANDVEAIVVHGDHTSISMLGDGKAFDPSAFIAPIDSADRSVAERFWTAFLQQGRAGSGGARAMVSTQADMLFVAVHGFVSWVVEVLRSQYWPTFYRLNFPGLSVSERPSVTIGGIKTPAFLRHAEATALFLDRLGVSLDRDGVARVFTGLELPVPEDVPTPADSRAMRMGGALRTEQGQRAAAGGA